MNDRIRAGQIQPRAAGFQGNQENLALARVKAVDKLQALPGGRFAVQIQRAHTAGFQDAPQDGEHGGELGKQQQPAAAEQRAGKDFHHRVELAAGAGVALQHQRRMAANLAKLRDGAEHFHAPMADAFFVQHPLYPLAQAQRCGCVDAPLLGRHVRQHAVFDFFRQLRQHVGLQTAQQERTNLPAQRVRAAAVAVAAEELRQGRQITGQDEMEDGPQLARVVLHGRSRQRQARARAEAARRQGGQGLRVFDMLRLVQHRKAERQARHQLDIPAQQGIRGNNHIHVRRVLQRRPARRPRLLPALYDRHGKLRGKVGQLRLPVIHQRRRRHHQRGRGAVAPLGPEHRGDDLERFAQPHIVGQHAAHAQAIEGLQPGEPAQLIRAQNPVERRGAGFAGAMQRIRHLARAFVNAHRQAALLQQRDQIGGPVCLQGHGGGQSGGLRPRGIGGRRVAFARVAEQARHLFPAFQARQVQKTAVPEAEIPLPVAQRAHQPGQIFQRRLAVQQRQLQRAAGHGQSAGKLRPARPHPAELFGGIYAGHALQRLHALLEKAQHALRAGQVNAPVAYMKSGVRQRFQHRVFALGVPYQQRPARIALVRRRKRIDHRFAIAERDARQNPVPVPVYIHARRKRIAPHAGGERGGERNLTRLLQLRQDLRHDPFGFARGKGDFRMPGRIDICRQRAQGPPLHRGKLRQEIGLQADKLIVRRDRHNAGRKPERRAQRAAVFIQRAGDGQRLAGDGLAGEHLASAGQPERARHQQAQQAQRRLRAQRHELAVLRQAEPLRLTGALGRFHLGQHRKDAPVRLFKAHGGRVERKALSEGDGLALFQCAQKRRQAPHDVQSLHAHAKRDMQRRFRTLGGQVKVDLQAQRRFLRQRRIKGAEQRIRCQTFLFHIGPPCFPMRRNRRAYTV